MNSTVRQINELIAIARDGERFYREAAGRDPDARRREILGVMADVHNRLVQELAYQVQLLGASPSQEGTQAGRLQQTYTRLLADTGNDATLQLAELEKAEERLLRHYRAALDTEPSEPLRELLERHLEAIEAARASMQALKEESSGKS